MKRIVFVIPAVALLAACETEAQSTAAGALTGAALGAAVSGDDDKVTGALIGGAVGAAAGNYLGKAQEPGKCVYRAADGSRFVADCP